MSLSVLVGQKRGKKFLFPPSKKSLAKLRLLLESKELTDVTKFVVDPKAAR